MMTITNDAVRRHERNGTAEKYLPRPRSAAPAAPAGPPGRDLLDQHRRAGTLAGAPLRRLPEVRPVDGVIQHTLNVEQQRDVVGDVAVDTGSCHPNISDEVLRVRAGDRLTIRPDGAQKGRTHTWEVPAGHPMGAHWYRAPVGGEATHHPLHGMLCPMVVEGEMDDVAGIADARERIMVINGLRREDTTFTLNGQLQPEVSIRPGEIQRWRVFNAEPHHAVRLQLDGHTLHQMAQDGIPFQRTRAVESVVLAPGGRAELLVRANRSGEYRLAAHSCDSDMTQPGPASQPTDLATMMVSGPPIFSRMPRELVDSPAAPAGPPAHTRSVRVSRLAAGPDVPGVRMVVDGDESTPQRVDQMLTAGTLERWTLVNDDDVPAFAHVIGHPFQVTDVQGGPAGDASWQLTADVWRDTLRLPPHGEATIRVYVRGSSARR